MKVDNKNLIKKYFYLQAWAERALSMYSQIGEQAF